ncbi:MAG: BadF/BadG/BcrA/BcrD ATPase family protein [Chloroflexota bacterium]
MNAVRGAVGGVRGAVLALDGGNSKTDVVLLATDGEVLAAGRSGPFEPQVVGAEAGVESFAATVAGVLRAAADLRVLEVSACLANADMPVEVAAIVAALARRRWGDHATVENDTFAVLRTGTDRGIGVAVVCGAGVNCLGVGPDGRQVRYPALGRMTGDWGGGLGLAEEAMWWAVRAEDGRGPATALAGRIAGHFRAPTATDVAVAFHLGTLEQARVHEIAALLFDAASAGDEVATRIVHMQADEIVTQVSTTLRRLDLTASPTDVVLGGGIIAAAGPVLLDPLTTRLHEAAPMARVRFLRDDPPVVGAALLGLERTWARHPETAPADRPAALLRARTGIRDQRGKTPPPIRHEIGARG